MELPPRHDGRNFSWVRPSSAVPAPLDKNGVAMLSNNEVGQILKYSPGNEKRAGYHHKINQYKVYPTKEMKDSAKYVGQNARTWFSHSDVVNHLSNLAAADPDKWGAVHKFHSKVLKSKIAAVDKMRKKTGVSYDYHNQQHPGNKDVHERAWEGTREYEPDYEEVGLLPPESPQAKPTYTSSDLKTPMKQGYMKRSVDL